MKILIAGGAGYIGSRLVPYLQSKGHNVDVLDLFWFGNFLPQNTKIIKKDLFELKTDDLTGYDAVIFLAGLSNDPMAEFSPALNFIHNAAGPAHLSYIAKTAGVKKFVYAGSCSVYGFAGSDTTSTEEDTAKSMYPYGISKLQGELAVKELDDENFNVVCLRQGTVCGHSPRMRFDLVINAMYKNAVTTGALTIDNPNIWRPILAITDALKAYEQALITEDARGVYNVSSGNFTVGEIGQAVAKRLQEKYNTPVKVNINNNPSFRNYRVSTEKAQADLKIDFTGSIENIVDDIFEKIGTEISDPEADRYYNVKIFKKLLENKQFTNLL